jgi:hypothetical protein
MEHNDLNTAAGDADADADAVKPNTKMEDADAVASKEDPIQPESTNANENPEQEPTSLAVKPIIAGPTYAEYRQKYCLTYVRTFFNRHLDDQWFRQRYSPLEYKRSLVKERSRAATEAQIMYNRVTVPITTSNSNGDIGVNTNTIQAQAKAFIKGARLGGGNKPTTTSTNPLHPESLPAVRKRTYGINGETFLANVPSTHLLSQMQNHALVEIMDVPPHVTHDQLKLALKEHCEGSGGSSSGGVVDMFSTSVAGVNGVCWAVSGENDKAATGTGVKRGSVGKREKELYYRTVWAVMESESAKVGTIS